MTLSGRHQVMTAPAKSRVQWVMRFLSSVAVLLMVAAGAPAQAVPGPQFEVATIKPIDPGPHQNRLLRMENDHSFVATNFTLKLLIAAAYDLNPQTISGGPAWVDADKFDVHALTPGEKRPDHDAQMLMLRTLLGERFHLQFHREEKTFAIYELSLAKDGPRLMDTKDPSEDPKVVTVVYADHLTMPAHNASMSDLARVMQRAILDHPVVDHTGLTGHYDFLLDWAPDERQFGGEIPVPAEPKAPPLTVALREQLGLELKATRGPVNAMRIDAATRPDN